MGLSTVAVRKSLANIRRVVTPADVERIAILKARGRTWQEIADDRGTSVANVISWFKNRVEPVWRALTGKHTHEEIARLNEIEREAWRQYERSAAGQDVDPPDLKAMKLSRDQRKSINKAFDLIKPTTADKGWLTLIMAVIDMRARLRGDYAPAKSALQLEATVRMAGSTPAAVDNQMLARLADRIKERRAYESAQAMIDGSEN